MPSLRGWKTAAAKQWWVAPSTRSRSSKTDRAVRLGVQLDLRNPVRWSRPWPDLYERALADVAAAEALGIDSVWLTEHHFFDDGYLPQLLTFAATSTALVPIAAAGLFMAKYTPGSMIEAATSAMMATNDSISMPP